MSAIYQPNKVETEFRPINPPAPGNPVEFQRKLDEVCRDRGIQLRVVWGPDRTKCILDGKIFKTYGITAGPVRILQGYQIRSFTGKVVGYEHLDGRIVGNRNGLRAPDYKFEQPAIERWIIEQRLNDDFARREHAKHRYATVDGVITLRCLRCAREWPPRYEYERHCALCGSRDLQRLETGGRKIDALGEYPADGWWKCFLIVGDHENDRSCCKFHESQLKVCIGLAPRMPDHRDLEIVEMSLKDRDEWEVFRAMDEPPTAREIQLASKVLRDELIESHEKLWGGEDRVGLIEKEVGEDLTPLFSAIDNPKFDIGGARRRVTASLKKLAAKIRG